MIHLDNSILTDPNKEKIQTIINYIKKYYLNTKVLGDMKYFIIININKEEEDIIYT